MSEHDNLSNGPLASEPLEGSEALSGPAARESLVTLFRETAEEIAEREFDAVDENTVIKELQMDSLAVLELVGTMERELGIKLREEQLATIQTVGQLLDLMTRVQSNHAQKHQAQNNQVPGNSAHTEAQGDPQ